MATTEAVTTTWFGRAVRMFLVFILVFGTSFRVEMAFAVDWQKDTLKKHADEQVITKLTVVNDNEEKVSNVTLNPGESVTLRASVKWSKNGTIEHGAAEYVLWNGDESAKHTVKNDLNPGDDDKTIEVKCELNQDALKRVKSDAEDSDITDTVKVKLVAPKIKVTLNANGGNVDSAELSGSKGDTCKLPDASRDPSVVDEGHKVTTTTYKLAAWKGANDASYKAGDTYTFQNNETLTAEWEESESVKEVTKVAISPSKVDALKTIDAAEFKATVTWSDKSESSDVEWAVSDGLVGEPADGGYIVRAADQNASVKGTVTCMKGDKADSCDVEFKPVAKVEISPSKTDVIRCGDSQVFTGTVKWGNGDETADVDWMVSDGLVGEPVEGGYAVRAAADDAPVKGTVTCVKGEKAASCDVEFKPATVKGVKIDPSGRLTLDNGASQVFTAEVTWDIGSPTNDVDWSVEGEGVVGEPVEGGYLVRAETEGAVAEATVVAKKGDKQDSCRVRFNASASSPADMLANHAEGDTLDSFEVHKKIGDEIGDAVKLSGDAIDSVVSGGDASFVAVPSWTVDGTTAKLDGKYAADYVKWSLVEAKANASSDTSSTSESTSAGASSEPAAQLTVADGVCTITDNSDGKGCTVTVRCDVADSAKSRVSGSFKPVEFTFKFDEARPPIAAEFKLGGKDLKDGETTLSLTREKDAKFEDYQLIASFRAYDENTSQDIITFTSDKGESLSKASNGEFTDLKWTIINSELQEVDKSLAEIDPATGLLKVYEDCSFTVQCTTTDKPGVQSWTAELSVVATTNGEESSSSSDEIDQGSPLHRQDTLHVTANVAKAAVAENAPGLVSSSSSASSSSSSSATSSAAGEGESSSSSSSAEDEKTKLEKTYTPAEIEAIGAGSTTYTMRAANGRSFTVTGIGPSLQALFTALGITNMDAVHSITFVDYAEQKVTVDWSTLSAGAPVVTTKSYVHDENRKGSSSSASGSSSSSAASGASSSAANSTSSSANAASSSASEATLNGQAEDDASPTNDTDDPAAPATDSNEPATSTTASEGASTTSATADEGEFLDYTRFRILYNGAMVSGLDTNSLRYIKEIRINPGEEVIPEPEPENPNAPFTVSVAYAPAPLNYVAVFSPVPSKEVAGATFDFVWEESADEGKTWKTVGTNQTYSVKTTKKNLGHLFRVTINSDMVNPDTGENYYAVSDPVEMVEASGFSVQLNYDPPIAGDIALFQSTIIDTDHDVDLTKLEYIWEMTEDNGKTWTRLAKQYQGKSTLSIQTDPIDETEEASDNADANLIYIRVRVVETTGKKRVRISNEQPLTVHVGEEKGTGEDKKNNAPPNSTPATVKKTDDTKTTDKKSKSDNGNSGEKPSKKKPTNDVPDDPDDSDDPEEEPDDEDPVDGTEDGTQRDKPAKNPSNEGVEQPSEVQQQPQPNSPAELNVNEDVTQKILEQQEAVQEYIESTVPGARWTALSSSQASGDDARNILSENPFAPFAIPTGLGITAAGALEKILFFRRQTK